MTTREREEGKQEGGSRQQEGGREGEESQRMGKGKAADLQKYLQGATYPADRQKIMDVCKRNGCSEDVMSALKKLPEKQYKSGMEVEEEYNKIE